MSEIVCGLGREQFAICSDLLKTLSFSRSKPERFPWKNKGQSAVTNPSCRPPSQLQTSLHHLLPAACQSPPASVAAPFTASAYPSPRLRHQNQLVSDSKAETCSLNSWALFLFPSVCEHKTISTADPRRLRSSGEIFSDKIMFLHFTVLGKWKVNCTALFLAFCLYSSTELTLRYFEVYWLHFPAVYIFR